MISLIVNSQPVSVEPGSTVAAAIISAGVRQFRRSVGGQQRAPLCGMGVCFECRVTVDGIPLQRSCTMIARDGMEILTDE